MLTSYSLGLKLISKGEIKTNNILLETFSFGLKRLNEKGGPSNKILMESFSLGLGEGSPSNIQIHRYRQLQK